MTRDDILDAFYDLTSQTALELQAFGQSSFKLGHPAPMGYLGVAVQDTRALLVGLQNILALHQGKSPITINLSSPESMEANNDFLSAMKAVHRCFFISVQTAIEAAAQQFCEERGITRHSGEKAFNRAVKSVEKPACTEWKAFYTGLKVVRNECAHPSLGVLLDTDVKKLADAGLANLVSEGRLSINCGKYLPIVERARKCISALEEANAK